MKAFVLGAGVAALLAGVTYLGLTTLDVTALEATDDGSVTVDHMADMTGHGT